MSFRRRHFSTSSTSRWSAPSSAHAPEFTVPPTSPRTTRGRRSPRNVLHPEFGISLRPPTSPRRPSAGCFLFSLLLHDDQRAALGPHQAVEVIGDWTVRRRLFMKGLEQRQRLGQAVLFEREIGMPVAVE